MKVNTKEEEKEVDKLRDLCVQYIFMLKAEISRKVPGISKDREVELTY